RQNVAVRLSLHVLAFYRHLALFLQLVMPIFPFDIILGKLVSPYIFWLLHILQRMSYIFTVGVILMSCCYPLF
ncbi:hypothetical protein L9F63_021183, partial [Diploptera punctata]